MHIEGELAPEGEDWALGKIRPAGISLMATGGLALLISSLNALSAGAEDYGLLWLPIPYGLLWLPMPVLTVMGVMSGLAMLIGGAQMYRQRTWWIAVAGATVGLVPNGFCCIYFFVPLACLIILNDPKAKAAFR